ncbi:MAG: peptidylprolyl isomerase [Gemmatimonadota bacterium]
MRRSLLLSLALVLAATPLFAQQPSAPGELADRIVAVVGDSIILKSDVDLELLQMRQANQPITDSVQTFKAIVERRVGELILLQAAARDTTIKLADDQITAEVNRELDGRRRQFGSEAAFQAALAQARMTLDELRRDVTQEVRGRILLREYMAKMSRDRLPPAVTDADIREYFEANQASFNQRPASISFEQIVIAPKASDTARASARAQAEEAWRKLREGADFETIAKQYSDDPATKDRGGDLGWFRSGTMVREFDQVAFSLRPGEISGIVETTFGFHIIKLEKTRGAERQARHILVIPTVTADDAERMRSYADEIAAKVRAGADFDSLTKAVGDPNEQARVGPFPTQRLPAPYNTALGAASVGQVVGPIELPGAAGASKFAIVRVTAVREAGAFSLDDPAFREDLRETLAQNTMVEELIRDLRRSTLVEYRFED